MGKFTNVDTAKKFDAEIKTEVAVAPKGPERVANVDENSALLLVKVGRPGNRKKQPAGDSLADDVDLEWVNLSKTLFESETFDAIKKADAKMRHWIYSRSVPTFAMKAGAYRVPLTLIDEVEAKLDAYRLERESLINAFASEWDEIVSKASEYLRDMYSEADYKPVDEMRARFRFEWRWVSVATPEKLARVSPALLQREIEKNSQAMRAEVDLIRDALRKQFKDLVHHMTQKLTFKEGEKKPVFRDSIVSNMKDFLNTFDALNLTNDAELEALVKDARRVMDSGVEDAQTLRDDDSLRADVATRFKEIKESLDASDAVEYAPSRKLTFRTTDEDDES